MLINNSKKIVIKLGSSTVVDRKGNFKKNWVNSLIRDIKKFKGKRDIVIVSSGAIALGQSYLKIKQKKIKLEMSQAIAAVGQIHLAGEYQKIFNKNNFKTGQILISPDDTEQRRRALNVRRTFDNLFKLKGDYYYDIFILFGNDWIKSREEVLRRMYNAYQKADQNGVNDYLSLYALGYFHHLNSESKKAIKYFERSLVLDSNYAPHIII